MGYGLRLSLPTNDGAREFLRQPTHAFGDQHRLAQSNFLKTGYELAGSYLQRSQEQKHYRGVAHCSRGGTTETGAVPP